MDERELNGFPVELLAALARIRDLAVALIATDLDGTVTHWNAYAEALYGWSADQAIGANIEGLTVGPVQQAQSDEIMAQLQSGRHWAGSFEARRSDGEYVEINVLDVPLVDRDGAICGLAGFSRETREQIDESLNELAELRRLANHLDKVRSDEARRIAGMLHDELSQGLHLLATSTTDLLREDLSPLVRHKVQALVDDQRQVFALIQSMWTGLRPPLLDEFGLGAAIEHLVRHARRLGEFEIFLRVDGALDAIPPDIAELALSVVNEALTNITKHALPETVWVALHVDDSVLTMSVEDDGVGVSGPPGFGLRLMRERLRSVGGEVAITPRADRGTAVRVTLPSGLSAR